MKLVSIVFSFRNEEKNLKELVSRVNAAFKKVENYTTSVGAGNIIDLTTLADEYVHLIGLNNNLVSGPSIKKLILEGSQGHKYLF